MPLFRMMHAEDDGSLIGLEPVDDGEREPLPAYCEDFPCCGHEAGDCNGQKYGSDEAIKQRVYERFERGEEDWPEEGEW